MKLIKLEKYETFDVIHRYGGIVNIYYLKGIGFINSKGEFSDDKNEIDKIENFLKNPIDPRIEFIEDHVKMAKASKVDGEETRGFILELMSDGHFNYDNPWNYLKVVGETEISEQDLKEFFDFDEQYKRARSNREKKLKSLIERINQTSSINKTATRKRKKKLKSLIDRV